MASTIDIDAPGAYPVTPLNEEPTQQTQQPIRNKLHKNPRGFNDSTERDVQRDVQRDAHPSGHNFAGSGIYVDEASLAPGANPIQSSHQNPFQQTQFNNNETPRTLGNLGNDTRAADHHLGGSSVHSDESLSARETSTSKPGIMTGAYSRVGTRDESGAPADNYTYNKQSASPQQLNPFNQRSQLPQQSGDAQLTSKAANAFTPVNSPAVTTPQGPSHDTTTNDPMHGSNKAQSGLREDSNAQHSAPYWGDIPFGTGIYNGVTGHGSKEPTTHQRSLHEQYDTSANTGVYNGVTGHGSKESTNSPLSQHLGRDDVTEDSHRQRVFPLIGTAHATTTSRSNENAQSSGDRSEAVVGDNLGINRDTTSASKFDDANRHENNSHFKELLAGAGAATAAGGYAAHKHSQNEGKDETSGLPTLREKPEEMLRQNNTTTARAQQPDHFRDAQTVDTNTNTFGDRNLTHRQFAAAPVGNQRVAEGQTASENYPARTTASSTQNRDKEDKSNLGYYGAAGAAAAGVGAFGMHEYNDSRDGNKNYQTSASRVQPELEQSHGRQQAGTAEREKPQYDTLSNGTPSGISAGTHHQHPQPQHQEQQQQQQESQRLSSDSSNGGQYNVLSSGTPSGINLEHVQAEKQQRRESDSSALLGGM